MNAYCITHAPHEGLGKIETWLLSHQHEIIRTRVDEGDPLPNPAAADLLIVMGGPMSVYDEARFRWIVDEKRCIEEAIKRRSTVFGICLGSQMVAVFWARG